MKSLSDEEARSIAPTLSRISERAKRPLTLDALTERWQSVVRQIEGGYGLTGYDYADDLATRDLIEEVLVSAPLSVREKVMASGVTAADNRFRAATRALTKPLTLAGPTKQHWWWCRAPDDMSADLARDILAAG